MELTIRRAGVDDLEHIRWALFTALAWNRGREQILRQVTLEHPEAARYHRDWGRAGDDGVIATTEGKVVGVAYFRLFTAEDHGHGYVDEQTPELAVAVRDDCRNRGVGARLMQELARVAREAGFARLSLSVDSDNPARRLYERLGYRRMSADENGVRMLIQLERADTTAEAGACPPDSTAARMPLVGRAQRSG